MHKSTKQYRKTSLKKLYFLTSLDFLIILSQKQETLLIVILIPIFILKHFTKQKLEIDFLNQQQRVTTLQKSFLKVVKQVKMTDFTIFTTIETNESRVQVLRNTSKGHSSNPIISLLLTLSLGIRRKQMDLYVILKDLKEKAF